MDQIAFTRTVAPLDLAVSLEQAKAHLRVDFSTDDVEIELMLRASIDQVEEYLRRGLVEQTWLLRRDFFRYEMRLPRAPLRGVTSVKYLDNDGTEQTLATTYYDVDTTFEPGRILRAYGQTWPSTRSVRGAVRLLYTCGYAAAAAGAGLTAVEQAKIPAAIRHAVLLGVGSLYEQRESIIVGTIVADNPTVKRLLDPYRVIDASIE